MFFYFIQQCKAFGDFKRLKLNLTKILVVALYFIDSATL